MTNDLFSFLKKRATKSGQSHTHTQIGSKELNVYGGSYNIPDEDVNTFNKLYIEHVFKNKKESYLTEKQNDNGPLLIDVDFRYSPEIEDRIHTKDHIFDLIQYITECMSKIKQINNSKIECYIFEKDDVNTSLEDVTKDGIHILINIQMDYNEKIILRNMIIDEISNIWNDIPITNTWSDVFDEGVIKGSVNWQLFGSRKPGYEPYKLKYILELSCNDKIWNIIEKKTSSFDVINNFNRLSARNKNGLVKLDLNPNIKEKYEEVKNKRTKKISSKNNVKKLSGAKLRKYNYQFNSIQEVDEYIDDYIINVDSSNYILKEVYEYTMIINEEYWKEGSYNNWIRVGWALKNTNEDLFIVWVKMSSQSDTFSISDIDDMYDKWLNMGINNKESLTYKSIIYWAKMSDYSKYEKIRKNTIDYYVFYSFKHNTEYDLATVLYHMFKDKFVCVNVKDGIWFEFINNRWSLTDSGTSLRHKISTEMFAIYFEKHRMLHAQVLLNNEFVAGGITNADNSEQNLILQTNTQSLWNDGKADNKDHVAGIGITATKLKQTVHKNNIMKESRELFYDPLFYTKLDTENYFIGCVNGVIDFKNKVFRKGQHDDYISKSTNLEYHPIKKYMKECPNVIKEINTFMEQLFPNVNLKKYVWQHLASTLLGTIENQTFNIYTGTGANGKSMLVELMSKVLGEYKGTVPITLITSKRGNIGSTSSEVYQLKGTRYAMMQEPSRGDVINEGPLKELTGGDPIQCRALYVNSITYTPQFKLAVMTNAMMDITSNDDGTWRRIRVVDFISKFTENPYNDIRFPKKNYPHQFKLDKKLNEKFEIWAPVFLSMLAEISFDKQGHVEDCDEVLSASTKYREQQDILHQFCSNKINIITEDEIVNSNEPVQIKHLFNQFKIFCSEYGRSDSVPKRHELLTFMEKAYGPYPTGGWTTIKLIM